MSIMKKILLWFSEPEIAAGQLAFSGWWRNPARLSVLDQQLFSESVASHNIIVNINKKLEKK